MYIYIEGNRERKKIAGGERDREWTSYILYLGMRINKKIQGRGEEKRKVYC